MSDHGHWLISRPPGDINFRAHLAAASEREIRAALAVRLLSGHRTAVRALEAELKRRQRAVPASDEKIIVI